MRMTGAPPREGDLDTEAKVCFNGGMTHTPNPQPIRTPNQDDCGHDHTTEQEAWECEATSPDLEGPQTPIPGVWICEFEQYDPDTSDVYSIQLFPSRADAVTAAEAIIESESENWDPDERTEWEESHQQDDESDPSTWASHWRCHYGVQFNTDAFIHIRVAQAVFANTYIIAQEG